MKIAINALAATGGGSQTYLRNLLSGFSRLKGHCYLIFVPESIAELPEIPDIRYIRSSARSRLARFCLEQTAVPFAAMRWGADVLFALSDLSPLVCSVPVVVACRDLDVYQKEIRRVNIKAWLRARVMGVLGRYSLERASAVVFESQAALHFIRDRYVRMNKTKVIYHGLDESLTGEHSPIETTSPRHLLCISAFYPHKNLHGLLKAFAHLVTRHQYSGNLVLAGVEADRTYSKQIKALARELNLNSRVVWAGHLEGKAKADAFQNAGTLVFPSQLESFGYPVIEAMQAGLPMALSDIPSFRELAEGTAVFFNPADPESMAEAILKIHTGKTESLRRIAYGRKNLKRFSLEREVDELLCLFDEICANPDSEPSSDSTSKPV